MMNEHLLAVDPGGTTGLAWCPLECLSMGRLDDRLGHMVSLGQIGGSVAEQSASLGRGIVRLRARAVISESSDHFLLRPRHGTMRAHSLLPIKMSGATQALCGIQNDRYRRRSEDGVSVAQMDHEGIWPVLFVEQTPSQAKSVVSNDVLVSLGIGWKNKNEERHQLDAARHLVLFLRRMNAGTGGFTEYVNEGMDKEAVRREFELAKAVRDS